MAISMLLAVLLAAVSFGESSYIAYNTTGGIVPGKINVHLVPHSHDDVGWLKTVDQYYVGANNSIRGACVQNVIDSVIAALLDDENRKFIYVEMAFFQRWWRQQSKKLQTRVKQLVKSGQLEFINGGMCMHDEATTHYIDLIDQTTLGHRYIKDEFGQTPRVGWQIDPFGHSAVQAYLLGAELGFDSLFFARIDYQDRARRKDEKTLEVVWQGSKSLLSTSQIFTGIFPRHYDPPDGFVFEINDISPPIQDDVLLFDYNVEERVNDFVAAAVSQANVTRTNHIMWTMGTDFRYQYANSWFRQMDKLIHYVNKDGRVNALYSTPSIYTDAKYAANKIWPLKKDDFFPYADHPNAYWTGYFTSRPAFKGYVRMMSSYYLVARQLEFFKGRNSTGPNTDALADALAIAQHHDAVSGTQRQHVAADYAKRLSIGYVEAEELVSSSLASLAESRLITGPANPITKFQQCPLLNISYCPPSEAVLSDGKSLVVVIYNPLGWKREEVVRIPVSTERLIVHDSSGKEIESQLLPVVNASSNTRNFYVKAYLGKSPSGTLKYWLAFSASVPPIGYSTYIISSAKQTGASSTISMVLTSEGNQNSTIEVGQGSLKLLYSADEGKLTHYINSRSLVTAFAEQSYSYYSGNDGTDKDPQASGAYVFRPNGTFPIKSEGQVPLTVLRGPILDEVHQELNPWIYQVMRIYKGKEHAEVEFTIGPIPVDDGAGKEITTQITTTLKTNKTFYTDSNGRDFIKRIRDYRADWDLQVNQPVAGNYYPINLGIYVQDDSMELSVLVDRSVGGSSLVDGQIELMLHRRLLHDDIRGVGEVLNEEVCVGGQCKGLTIQGKLYIRIDPVGEGAKWRRTFGQEIYSPLLLAFAEQDGNNWMESHLPTFSGLDPSYVLPNNTALITLEELENGKLLLRLAHLYETGEDKDYSVMATVELKKLLHNIKITKATETSLSANQERSRMENKKLIWEVEGSSEEPKVVRGGPVDPAKLVVQLAPMEIRVEISVSVQLENSSDVDNPSVDQDAAELGYPKTRIDRDYSARVLIPLEHFKLPVLDGSFFVKDSQADGTSSGRTLSFSDKTSKAELNASIKNLISRIKLRWQSGRNSSGELNIKDAIQAALQTSVMDILLPDPLTFGFKLSKNGAGHAAKLDSPKESNVQVPSTSKGSVLAHDMTPMEVLVRNNTMEMIKMRFSIRCRDVAGANCVEGDKATVLWAGVLSGVTMEVPPLQEVKHSFSLYFLVPGEYTLVAAAVIDDPNDILRARARSVSSNEPIFCRGPPFHVRVIGTA